MLEPLLLEGRLATCSLVDLELLFSARGAREFQEIHGEREAFERVPIVQADFDRAIEVMAMLATTGQHRVSIPDLIIAAVAERAELVVLHYDKDFQVIAEVTKQPAQWVMQPHG